MGPDRICLCGYMGAGKTEVGKRLASLLGYAFLDLDDVVAATAPDMGGGPPGGGMPDMDEEM